MITAKFHSQNGHYTSYSLNGHAEYAPHGQDIVCAGVSALFIGISNVLLDTFGALDKSAINENAIELVDANEQTDLLVETLHKSLVDIEKSHPNNLKVHLDDQKRGHQGGVAIFKETDEGVSVRVKL